MNSQDEEPPTKKFKADDRFEDAEESIGSNHLAAVASNGPATLISAKQEEDDDEEDLFGDGGETAEAKPASVIEPSSKTKTEDGSPVEGKSLPTASEVVKSEESSMVIPRKASAIKRKIADPPTSSLLTTTSAQHADQRVPGTRYGLPQGVVVPQTIVENRLLDVEMHAPGSKLLEILKSLPVNLINDALTEYDDAVAIKGSTAIRNHGAYLFGVVKRYVSVHERALAGEGTGILPMGEDGLTEAVEQRLQQLVTSGFCSEQEMNDKVKSKIRMLSEKDAMFALEELSSVDRSSIRNFGSYFMGILNRYMRGDASSKIRPKNHNQQQNRFPQSSSYPPRDRDPYNNAYRNPGNDFRPNNNMYDNNRQQNSWQQPPMGMNHQRPQGLPPTNMPQGGPMMSHNQRPGYGRPPHPPPQHFDHHQQQQAYTNMNQSSQQQQQQHAFVHQPPGYPPSHPPQHQGFPNNNGGYQQPQMNTGGHQQQFHMGNQQMSQNQPRGQQVSQQHGGQPFRGPGWQDQPNPSLDIMGLADKAASAIQALGGAGGGQVNMNQHYPPPPQQQMQQQGGYQQYRGGERPGVGQQMPPHQFPQQSQPFMQQPQSDPQFNANSYATDQRPRRRTTAGIAELPIAVQYAVQNLVATRSLDAIPDEGILGMIHDLPEPLALASLQKFETLSSAKQSMMRNKTAYLAGVLRRELEKINRR